MKNSTKIWGTLVLVAIYLLIKCCDGSSTDSTEDSSDYNSINSVESLYGTYTATTKGGTKVKVVLRSDSKHEWKKYGTDYSDNLITPSTIYDNNRGYERQGWKPIESQGIEWSWDLRKGYIKVYYDGRERYIIDINNGKMYGSWGEYLDKRNGFSYSFSK